MLKQTLIAALVLAAPVAGAEDVAYVTDILRLGIYEAQDTSGRPFQNLVSGTALTVLERVPNYARVRTPDGREGWVRSAFIVTEKPAQLRLAEMTAELESMQARIDAAETARNETEASVRQMTEELSAKISAADAVQDRLARLEQENSSYASMVERYRGSVPIAWAIGALVVVFAAGALAGTWWLDRSIRRRFGGHRIY